MKNRSHLAHGSVSLWHRAASQKLWRLPMVNAHSFRYAVVMAIGWLVDLGVFALLVAATGIAVAQFAARLAGALTGFVLHRTVTFARSGRYAHPPLQQLLAFALVWAANYGVTVVGIELIVHGTGWNPVIAKVLVECIVVPSNFLVLRHLVFRNE